VPQQSLTSGFGHQIACLLKPNASFPLGPHQFTLPNEKNYSKFRAITRPPLFHNLLVINEFPSEPWLGGLFAPHGRLVLPRFVAFPIFIAAGHEPPPESGLKNYCQIPSVCGNLAIE
jgi:hypothetical protein